jgi:hypothetical protein
MTLAVLMRPLPVEWDGQQMAIAFCAGTSRPD